MSLPNYDANYPSDGTLFIAQGEESIRTKAEQLRLQKIVDPKAHKSRHATGGDDAIAPSDIDAAPIANPVFTGKVAIGSGAGAYQLDSMSPPGTISLFRIGAISGVSNGFTATADANNKISYGVPGNVNITGAITVSDIANSSFAPKGYGEGTTLPVTTAGIASTSIAKTGRYYANAITDSPVAQNYGYLEVLVYSATYKKVKFSPVDSVQSWEKICNNGVWTEWKRGATTDQITTPLDYVVSQSLGENGYRIWHSGRIEQWGYVLNSSATYDTVTFPTPFPTACIRVIKVWENWTGLNGLWGTHSPKTLNTLTGFTADDYTKTNRKPYYWNAEGN